MNELEKIEELRRRAKDNSADNVKYYLTKAFESLSQIRNLLITISTSGIVIVHSQFQGSSQYSTIAGSLWCSIVFGFVSYLTHWIALQMRIDHAMKREQIWRDAYLTKDEFNDRHQQEAALHQDNTRNVWTLSLCFLLLQAAFLLYALRLLI